ncbi:putative reverse transcriptase zinc-binding domain-containing protein [Arabidopsis thaliana]
MLFTAAGSLWVSWVRVNLIRNKNFWDLNPSFSWSWILRRLCKLRTLARPFIVCEVGSGVTANFWLDNWTSHGPLIDLTGPTGPQITGLPRDSAVRDALRGNDWWISASRSRNLIISLIKGILPPVANKAEKRIIDTWLALHPIGNRVDWHKAVWFKNHIPKHAFICWVSAWNRLHTRDRLRRWSLNIPSSCVLCNSCDETRDHLFFDCHFSSQVWRFFISASGLSPPFSFKDSLLWVRSPSPDKKISFIL